MSWIDWLRGLFRRPPGRVTNVRIRVIPMKEIALEWAIPAIREDGSAMPAAEVDYTEVTLSTDGARTFTPLAKVKADATQAVKRAPAPDGDYTFRFVVVGINGKRGKPFDKGVKVDTPAPGALADVKATVT
jgi:hypothetical protein